MLARPRGRSGSPALAAGTLLLVLLGMPHAAHAWIPSMGTLSGWGAPRLADLDAALAPTRPSFWCCCGDRQLSAGRYSRAIACFRHALRINPKSVCAWIGLGIAYEGLGRAAEAIAGYRQAIAIEPKNVYAWYDLGNVYRRQEDYAEAIASYRHALRVRPDYVLAWNNLGIAYDSQQRYSEALACFRKAVRLKPDFRIAWKGILWTDRLLGRNEEARAAVSEAKRRDRALGERLQQMLEAM